MLHMAKHYFWYQKQMQLTFDYLWSQFQNLAVVHFQSCNYGIEFISYTKNKILYQTSETQISRVLDFLNWWFQSLTFTQVRTFTVRSFTLLIRV